jgi:Ser/Thr protein kinase RdoA (MazF antagonist)
MKFFIEMILGLNEMRKKHILHRDIKPGNVLLNESKDEVKLGLTFSFAFVYLNWVISGPSRFCQKRSQKPRLGRERCFILFCFQYYFV